MQQKIKHTRHRLSIMDCSTRVILKPEIQSLLHAAKYIASLLNRLAASSVRNWTKE